MNIYKNSQISVFIASKTPTSPINVFTGCSKQIIFYCGKFRVRIICNVEISKTRESN